MTGGCGKLGRVLAKAFLKAGWKVVAIDRPGCLPRGLPRGVELRHADLADASDAGERALRAAVRGCSVVVHAAGLVDYCASRKVLWRANVETTRLLLAACRGEFVGRFVLISSTSVHRIPKYLPIDELHEFTPVNDYGRSKAAAEELVRRSHVPFVVLRLAALYGPSFAPQFERFKRAALQGKLRVIGGGGNRLGFVFESDAADAVVTAASSRRALGEEFIIASEERLSQAELLEAFCKAFGKQLPAKPLSKRFAYLAARVESLKKLVGLRPKLSFEDVHTLSEDRHYDAGKARRLLGWRAAVPFARGLQKMVAAMTRGV